MDSLRARKIVSQQNPYSEQLIAFSVKLTLIYHELLRRLRQHTVHIQLLQ